MQTYLQESFKAGSCKPSIWEVKTNTFSTQEKEWLWRSHSITKKLPRIVNNTGELRYTTSCCSISNTKTKQNKAKEKKCSA